MLIKIAYYNLKVILRSIDIYRRNKYFVTNGFTCNDINS